MIDTKIYQLDLPAPTEELLHAVTTYIKNVKLDWSAKQYLDEVNNNNINSALHLFSSDDNITKMIREQYAHFFTEFDIIAIIGIMKNPSSTELACQPPHVDRYRSVAINYYIQLGGDQVKTSFYDCSRPIISDASSNFRYGEVEKIGQFIFDKNQWYAYNVTQCHSVEDIVNERHFLSIAPVNFTNYTIEDVVNNPKINGRLVKL